MPRDADCGQSGLRTVYIMCNKTMASNEGFEYLARNMKLPCVTGTGGVPILGDREAEITTASYLRKKNRSGTGR